MSHKLAVIIRGPSGSGKSTLTKNLIAHYKERGIKEDGIVVCSSDDFFMKYVTPRDSDPNRRIGGSAMPPKPREKEYVFNPSKLGEAHAQCLSTFIGAITDKEPVVILDNTNIHMWEWRNYCMIAMSHGYEVQVQEFRVDTVEQIQEVARRNVHRVPADIVHRMCMEFEPYAGAVVHQIFPAEQTSKKLQEQS